MTALRHLYLVTLAFVPAAYPKRILLQHTFSTIPGRPRAGTKQTKRARKKLPKPNPRGDGKRPPATRAKDPETAREARREYERARNRTPERREYRRRYAEEQRQRAKLLGKCQKCSKPAIPRQTRCPQAQLCRAERLDDTSARLIADALYGRVPTPLTKPKIR